MHVNGFNILNPSKARAKTTQAIWEFRIEIGPLKRLFAD